MRTSKLNVFQAGKRCTITLSEWSGIKSAVRLHVAFVMSWIYEKGWLLHCRCFRCLMQVLLHSGCLIKVWLHFNVLDLRNKAPRSRQPKQPRVGRICKL